MKNGTKLIVMDPRRSELARTAYRFLQFKPDTDVALLNAMMHVIVEEHLVDAKFVADRTLGYADLVKNVAGYSPELMAPICGIPAETIREVARLYATSAGSIILWGNGHQPTHPRHRQCPLSHRARLMTGQIGKPGSGTASLAWTKQRSGCLGRGV